MARPRPKLPKRLLAAKATGTAPSPALDWVSRALSRAGVLPGRAAEDAVRAGRVALDGRTVREPLTPVPDGARVTLDGRAVDVAPRTLVLTFHKPKGLVVHGHDEQGGGTVFEALAAVLPPALKGYGWLAVGRLDRDTTGLLLFTNDERFVAHATRPESHLPKRYVARVGGAVTDVKLERLRAGLELPTYRAKPAQARLREPGVVELVLTEGKYHQVKAMLGALGLPTLALHREAVGGLVLDVAEGAVRRLSDDEVRRLLRYEPRHG